MRGRRIFHLNARAHGGRPGQRAFARFAREQGCTCAPFIFAPLLNRRLRSGLCRNPRLCFSGALRFGCSGGRGRSTRCVFEFAPAFPQGTLPRFLRLLFTPVGTFTAGAIASASVTMDRDDYAAKYAGKNFAVA